MQVLEELLKWRDLRAAVMPDGRPVHIAYVSSRFGPRIDPFTGRRASHKGIDFAGAAGSQVVAVAAGIVTSSGARSGYGKLVEIDHWQSDRAEPAFRGPAGRGSGRSASVHRMSAAALRERSRAGALLACCAVIAAAWLGPLPELALERFAAQAALHVVLVSIAAPLLAASVAGSPFDPVRRWPHGMSPLALSLLQAAVVWGWHAPAAQLAARAEPGLLWLQQGTLLVASVLLWVSVLGGDRAARYERYERVGAGIVALLMTSVHMTLLGGLALISSSPYFGAEIAASIDDRRVGALLTLAGAVAIYAVAGALLLAWLLKPGTAVAASPGVTTAGGRS